MNLNILRYIYIPIIIAAVIFYLCCLIPVNDIPDIGDDWSIPIDKIVHFLMYFGLSGITAFNYLYIKKGKINTNTLLIGAFLIPILYGGFIEILQHYFFYPRMGDWDDFLADVLGSIAALPISLLFRNYLKQNKYR